MLFNNKLFNSIACLLSFTNLQLVIPGRTWILLYLGRTVYKRLWACLALYVYKMFVLNRYHIPFTSLQNYKNIRFFIVLLLTLQCKQICTQGLWKPQLQGNKNERVVLTTKLPATSWCSYCWLSNVRRVSEEMDFSLIYDLSKASEQTYKKYLKP